MTTIYEQAAVIPWRVRRGRCEIALITSRSGRRWIIPKGLIDPGETAAESAARETEEEAGLRGPLGDEPLGEYEYAKWGGTCRVVVFSMEVAEELDTWMEDDFRERCWFAAEDAGARLGDKALRRMVRQLAQAVAG